MGGLKAENERLRELLRETRELIEHGDFREGHCMCGSAVDDHTFGDGHTPCDAGEYYAGQVRERIDAALSQQAEPQKSCKWTRDDDTGAYETACGVTWHLSDGGEPEEHGQYFCHHCGKRIDDEGADHE